MSFYSWINIGSLSSVATIEIEQNYGFEPTFLLPLLVPLVGFSIYLASMRHWRSQPPTALSYSMLFKFFGSQRRTKVIFTQPRHLLRGRKAVYSCLGRIMLWMRYMLRSWLAKFFSSYPSIGLHRVKCLQILFHKRELWNLMAFQTTQWPI